MEYRTLSRGYPLIMIMGFSGTMDLRMSWKKRMTHREPLKNRVKGWSAYYFRRIG